MWGRCCCESVKIKRGKEYYKKKLKLHVLTKSAEQLTYSRTVLTISICSALYLFVCSLISILNINYLLLHVNRQSFASSYQLSIVGFLSSIVGYFSSIVGYFLSIVFYFLSIVCCFLSIVCYFIGLLHRPSPILRPLSFITFSSLISPWGFMHRLLHFLHPGRISISFTSLISLLCFTDPS